MSDLDDLGEIADQLHFGTSATGLSNIGVPRGGRKPWSIRCGSPDHMKGPNIRIYRVKGRKTRTVCKLCDKVRKEFRHG